MWRKGIFQNQNSWGTMGVTVLSPGDVPIDMEDQHCWNPKIYEWIIKKINRQINECGIEYTKNKKTNNLWNGNIL